jgi:hypothetical protein
LGSAVLPSPLAEGAREAKSVSDDTGAPATLTECGRVLLLRVIDQERKGYDRIDLYLAGDDDDADDEIVLASKDRVLSLQENGADPPEFVTCNRDVSSWLSIVLLD